LVVGDLAEITGIHVVVREGEGDGTAKEPKRGYLRVGVGGHGDAALERSCEGEWT